MERGRAVGGGAGSDSLQAHRHGEIAAELLGEVDRDTGMDAALAVEELGMVVDRDYGTVPDIWMDVEPALAVAPEPVNLSGVISSPGSASGTTKLSPLSA